jgi:hypothetical protein
MQKKVEQFNEQVKQFHTKQMSVQARVLDIQSEVGELAKRSAKINWIWHKRFCCESKLSNGIWRCFVCLAFACA